MKKMTQSSTTATKSEEIVLGTHDIPCGTYEPHEYEWEYEREYEYKCILRQLKELLLLFVRMSEQHLPLSDLEQSNLSQQQQESSAAAVLETFGSLLQQADEQLDALEQEDILGSAIYRGSQDLAKAIGGLADRLEHQSEEEQRALANACLRDVQEHALYLQEQDSDVSNQALTEASADELANMNENDFIKIIQASGAFLRDVEASLQAMELQEAEEVADVALTVSRLFVASLQSVHAQMVPEDLLIQQPTARSSSVTIALIDEEEEPLNDTPQKRKKRQDRLRVLWPPLGPALQKACQWGQRTASEHTLLAIALGFTLWPAAIVSAFVGTPVLIADKVVQDLYNHFQEHPLLENLERGAAQLCHTGRLALVSGKLVGRQGLRIANRQIDRHGGLPQIAQTCVSFAVDRATHPVETASMVWGGLCWTTDRVRETIEQLQDEERNDAIQELQQ